MIDRELLQRSFDAYINRFDAEDERISLKIRHTAFVAENSDSLSASLGLSPDDRDLAWAVAMLHDIGRFEQAAANGSFLDSVSSDHAAAGVEYLFEQGHISDFVRISDPSAEAQEASLAEAAENLKIIRLAVAWHNKHELPSDLSEREQLFCRMIRDADKLDIFRVCVENTFAVAHEYPPETVAASAISPAVAECFERFETLDYKKRKTPADIFIGHLALSFGLFYPQSRRIAAEQGYLEKMADFTFEQPETQEQYEWMKARLFQFLDRK